MREADKQSFSPKDQPNPLRKKLNDVANRQEIFRKPNPFREFAVDAVLHVHTIPDEKLGEIAYEIDDKAIDNPIGRNLLAQDGPLSSKWAETQSTMTYFPEEASENLKKFRGEIAGRLANIEAEKQERGKFRLDGLSQNQRNENTLLASKLIEALNDPYFNSKKEK